MPIYQMLCIAAHFPDYKHIHGLVKQSALLIMDAGVLNLPQRMRRHGNYHEFGDYWMMHFDTSPRILLELNSLMRRDPRVIRWTVLKLGSRPEDIAKEGRRTIHGDHLSTIDV
ncbi:hypothetical protein B0H13DRAFT_2229845 [Mycena leptocephala]|nr:hypothetical protein B0H13DRAFT_2229845 [Mycena leptocephala]